MSFHGKRERVEDGNGYGPPQKRPGAGFSGGPPQSSHGSYSGHGRPPYEGFSSQYNQPPASQPRSGPYPPFAEDKSGCVLLVTVINPKYPITVDVINTICTNSSAIVNRIVIMKKNGVQAMIEFDSPQAAETIKETLNGADIYSGCCTLKIEYAKVSRLNVTKNDQDSWDYTLSKQGQDAKVLPLLPDPKFNAERGGGGPGFSDYLDEGKRGAPQGPPPSGYDGGYQDRYRGPGGPGGPDDFNFHRNAPGDRFNSGGGHMPPSRGPPGPRQEFHPPAYEPHGSRYPSDGYGSSRGRGNPYSGGPGRGGQRPMYPPMGGGPRMDEYQEFDDAMGSGPMLQQGSVMMVYGLEAEKMNCMRLFNLFCLYGNVVRIKFLKSKDGVAMVQMGDCHSCERAANGLNGTFLFGKKILIGNSKQAFIQDVPNPSDLPDGSPSFKDFMGNRNNRFTTPEAAAKNRIHSSSKILYFFNAPPGLKEEDLMKVFRDGHVKEPKKIKVFPTKSEKSSTGLIEWDSKSDSVEALVVCNHTPLQNPTGKNPYILKFCFSDVTIKNTPSSNAA